MKISDQYFNSKEFQELFQRYKTAEAEGRSIYLEPDELADIAEYYQMLGNVDDALNLVDQGLQTFPTATSLLVLKSRSALCYENDTEKAKAFLSQIVDKDSFEYYYIKAEIMLAEGNVDEANRYLLDVADTLYDDELEDFYVDIAAIFADYDYYDVSSEWLQRSTDYDATDYKELQGRIAMHKGNFEESERIFNELIDNDPYSAPYWNHLASVQLQHNKIRDSIQSSEFSIAINPDNCDAILNKANGLFSLGNFTEARKFYKRYAELCPNEETGELFQGICSFNLGEISEGIKHLREAEMVVDPDSENCLEVYQELAFALSRNGQGDEALEYIDKMLNLVNRLETGKRPEKALDYNEIMVLKGHLLMEMGKYKEGQLCYSEAIRNSGGSPHIFLRAAISIYDLGFFKHAYKMFQIIRQATGDTYDDGYAYEALCCYALNRYDDFCELVKKACERNPIEARIVLSELFPEDLDVKDYYQWLADGNKPLFEP